MSADRYTPSPPYQPPPRSGSTPATTPPPPPAATATTAAPSQRGDAPTAHPAAWPDRRGRDESADGTAASQPRARDAPWNWAALIDEQGTLTPPADWTQAARPATLEADLLALFEQCCARGHDGEAGEAAGGDGDDAVPSSGSSGGGGSSSDERPSDGESGRPRRPRRLPLAHHGPAVRSLNLTSRGLTALTPHVARLGGRLERLSVSSNRIATLPAAMASLVHLRYLNVRGNQLRGVLPPVLGELPSLAILDLSRNKLTQWPARPGHLVRLRVLSVTRNRFVTLPAWIAEMNALEVFKADRNPIVWPPPDIMYGLAPSIAAPPGEADDAARDAAADSAADPAAVPAHAPRDPHEHILWIAALQTFLRDHPPPASLTGLGRAGALTGPSPSRAPPRAVPSTAPPAEASPSPSPSPRTPVTPRRDAAAPAVASAAASPGPPPVVAVGGLDLQTLAARYFAQRAAIAAGLAPLLVPMPTSAPVSAGTPASAPGSASAPASASAGAALPPPSPYALELASNESDAALLGGAHRAVRAGIRFVALVSSLLTTTMATTAEDAAGAGGVMPTSRAGLRDAIRVLQTRHSRLEWAVRRVLALLGQLLVHPAAQPHLHRLDAAAAGDDLRDGVRGVLLALHRAIRALTTVLDEADAAADAGGGLADSGAVALGIAPMGRESDVVVCTMAFWDPAVCRDWIEGLAAAANEVAALAIEAGDAWQPAWAATSARRHVISTTAVPPGASGATDLAPVLPPGFLRQRITILQSALQIATPLMTALQQFIHAVDPSPAAKLSRSQRAAAGSHPSASSSSSPAPAPALSAAAAASLLRLRSAVARGQRRLADTHTMLAAVLAAESALDPGHARAQALWQRAVVVGFIKAMVRITATARDYATAPSTVSTMTTTTTSAAAAASSVSDSPAPALPTSAPAAGSASGLPGSPLPGSGTTALSSAAASSQPPWSGAASPAPRSTGEPAPPGSLPSSAPASASVSASAPASASPAIPAEASRDAPAFPKPVVARLQAITRIIKELAVVMGSSNTASAAPSATPSATPSQAPSQTPS